MEKEPNNYATLVRELLSEALAEDEIRDLCFDHFRLVFDEISAGMSRKECIRRLVAWCYRQRRLEFLVALVGEINPDAHKAYEPRLAQITEKYAETTTEHSVEQLAPGIVHVLPPAPTFVGRVSELEMLQEFWLDGAAGVFAVLGLGGAGKTALGAEFLDRVQKVEQKPDGLFVWSFYVSQDVNQFLEAAYLYFSRGKLVRGSGMGIFYMLMDILGRSARYLIVLDGLERVQRPKSDSTGAFGDLTDPLLAQIVARLASGLGKTKCVITSRFPLKRLAPWEGKSYHFRDIDQLERGDARLLLRRHKVKGDDTAIDKLIDEFGAHALTLDHLGGYLHEYCNGNSANGIALPEPQMDSIEPQERRLARVLQAYEAALSEAERTLLARVCIFRFGVTPERLHAIFSSSQKTEISGPLLGLRVQDFQKMLKHLAQLHLVLHTAGDDNCTAHPAVRDHFYRTFTDPSILHQAIRRHYSSLVLAPGTALPEQDETIDLLEELMFHTLQAGQTEAALEIFQNRLGGVQHLAWRLGHYSRSIRILKEFPQCPDRGGLIWCYRAVGDLEAALSVVDPDDTWWLGMIGSLRGRLKEVVEVLSGNRNDPIRMIAEVLTGIAPIAILAGAPIWPGIPISAANCFLETGKVEDARECVERYRAALENSVKEATWSDEIAHYDLTEAEIERCSRNFATARSFIEKATQWIVKSGSQEHMCILHLNKARLALDEGEFDLARTVITEGLHTAEQCGFGLYHLQLLIEQARYNLLIGKPDEAVRSATGVRNGIQKSNRIPADRPDCPQENMVVCGANHPACGLVWENARAGYLLGQAYAQLQETALARSYLQETIALQRRLGDSRLKDSEDLYRKVCEPIRSNA